VARIDANDPALQAMVAHDRTSGIESSHAMASNTPIVAFMVASLGKFWPLVARIDGLVAR
jgi:hypothetical protein